MIIQQKVSVKSDNVTHPQQSYTISVNYEMQMANETSEALHIDTC